MHLKSLIIKGFKSFAKKTVLDFEPGVTMIVGPNGSGKSNTVDAIQWVLGEQSPSQLRGSAMEDVIFAGTEYSKPLSLCEISLVLDNSDGTIPIDYNEINISRRMLKTGESNYFINGSPCRLLDIFELLSDSGLGRNTHSIIAQGKIDQIIHCKPDERRHLIEEAAGVLKHKKRKDRSLRKLISVDDNLKRAKDILREVKKQSGPLKNQIEKAEAYSVIEKRLKNVKIASTVKKLNHLKERFVKIEETRSTINKEIQDTEENLLKKQALLKNAEKELESLQNKYNFENKRYIKHIELKSSYEKTFLMFNKQIDMLNNRLTSLNDYNRKLLHQLDINLGKEDHLEKEKGNLEKEINRTYKRLKISQKKATDIKLRWKKDHDELLRKEQVLKSNKEEALKAKESSVNLKTSLNTCKEKINFLKKELENLNEERRNLSESIKANGTQLAEETIAFQKADSDLRNLLTQKNKIINKIVESEKNLISLEKDFNRAQSRKEALENVFNLEQTEADNFISLNSIKIEAGYEKAFESALSSFNNMIIALDRKDMEERLLTANHGSKIVNLNFKPSTQKNKHALINKVKAPEKIIKALAVILDNVYVADNLNEIDDTSTWFLKNGTKYHKGILWVPGEFNVEGEYGSLNQKLKTIVKEKGIATENLESLKIKQENLENKINSIKEIISKINENTSTLKQKNLHITEKIEHLKLKEGELERNIAIEKLSHSKLNQEYISVLAIIKNKETETKELENIINPIDRDIDSSRLAAEKEIHEIKLSLTSLNERLLFIKQQINENNSFMKNTQSKIKTNESKITKLNGLLLKSKNIINYMENIRPLTTLFNSHEVIDFDNEKKLIADLKNEYKSIEQTQNELKNKIDKSNLEEVEIKAKVDAVTEKITEDFQISLESALELADFEYKPGEASILEQQLKDIGPINFTAVEQFKSLQGREEFLEKQVEDLTNSKKSLRRIIKAIDDKIRESMLESFELVKIHFNKMFDILFPGGKSNLYLTDEDDILNTGVELEVQPAGKKLSKLSLLSGGETALTALALLFAIYHAKPSPFYVLDEVEAALDDINLQRFICLIEEMKMKTQFIVITHQRRTMEVADCLYGVTMQTDGISRVISQKLEKLEKSPHMEAIEVG